MRQVVTKMLLEVIIEVVLALQICRELGCSDVLDTSLLWWTKVEHRDLVFRRWRVRVNLALVHDLFNLIELIMNQG